MEERAGGYETGREETDPLGSGGSQAPGGAIGAFGKQEAELNECYVNLQTQNKQGRRSCPVVHLQLAVSAHLSEALAAEHGTVGLGLEGNLGLAAATGAGSGEELTGATGGVLASVTAGLAALGLVLEAALCVELLLTSGEHELVAALFAN